MVCGLLGKPIFFFELNSSSEFNKLYSLLISDSRNLRINPQTTVTISDTWIQSLDNLLIAYNVFNYVELSSLTELRTILSDNIFWDLIKCKIACYRTFIFCVLFFYNIVNRVKAVVYNSLQVVDFPMRP